ncbi:MAG: hypothetical protein WD942_06710 [Dehalococcoidia bacterium]
MSPTGAPLLTVVIDTEEDNWGSYAEHGATTRNIAHLRELQEVFDRFGARPTYVVNRPPLIDTESVRVLGELAERRDIEIGTHCHPWNTPPFTGASAAQSMMCSMPVDTNRAKLRSMTELIRQELNVHPVTFRAGRWGFGPTVARALVDEGYLIDCSVSPSIDWTDIGGPDFSEAPRLPYRCAPDAPFTPHEAGPLVELPTTVGYLRGDPPRRNRIRKALEGSLLARLKAVGVLDRSTLLARRWLSPEVSTTREMIRIAARERKLGNPHLSLTFHSSTLLPGATPFVRDSTDRQRFLGKIRSVLQQCQSDGLEFATIHETAAALGFVEAR